MRYRLVVFDVDGTLADSFPWFAGVLNSVADRFGFRRVNAAERDALRHCDSREILRRLQVPSWKLPLIAMHMRKLKAEAVIPLFPEVPQMLARLQAAGLTLGIVSSDSEANIRAALGPETAARIAHWGCGAGLFGKPAKLRRLARQAGVAPALYIGDEQRDAEAAAKAGFAFGAVLWGYASPAALLAQSPAEVFATPADITARLG
ncbi:phosphoglycolate phosphatase [Siccirubricoccus deserti]|uniref:HAD hydrolase-like protein n=1 Tax=Siccirubricoccus deserti TaxID=2013562 RepID=A0A9X0UCZ6_9PROT|nr:HAD hydrolase-like protein [Siccirubricoccus deserti]MBC4015792.1 HAD hydrolase-like protein [Siccirubricoccus deserti]GGC44668.1 phosphoglycolate phosphatase [Siccirubricoccus deserti]